jgi:hypothetical protein
MAGQSNVAECRAKAAPHQLQGLFCPYRCPNRLKPRQDDESFSPSQNQAQFQYRTIARERIEVHQAAEDFERAWLNFITACTRLRTLSFCMMFVM